MLDHINIPSALMLTREGFSLEQITARMIVEEIYRLDRTEAGMKHWVETTKQKISDKTDIPLKIISPVFDQVYLELVDKCHVPILVPIGRDQAAAYLHDALEARYKAESTNILSSLGLALLNARYMKQSMFMVFPDARLVLESIDKLESQVFTLHLKMFGRHGSYDFEEIESGLQVIYAECHRHWAEIEVILKGNQSRFANSVLQHLREAVAITESVKEVIDTDVFFDRK